MPTRDMERQLGGIVCGIDEAGRGPLAGPVVAAAVVLAEHLPAGLAGAIDDSKKLGPRRRAAIAAELPRHAAIGIGEADVGEIERLNILNAALLAMQRAFAALARPIDHALIDGNRAPSLACPAHAVIGGDALCLSIAAASIVAKIHRDGIMAALARRHPGYGWERNAGYGTAEHCAALKRLGPTPHHRAHFAPVAALARGPATSR